LVIVWALRGCHVYPNTGVKWLTKNTIQNLPDGCLGPEEDDLDVGKIK
jgi:hypothetical protein